MEDEFLKAYTNSLLRLVVSEGSFWCYEYSASTKVISSDVPYPFFGTWQSPGLLLWRREVLIAKGWLTDTPGPCSQFYFQWRHVPSLRFSSRGEFGTRSEALVPEHFYEQDVIMVQYRDESSRWTLENAWKAVCGALIQF